MNNLAISYAALGRQAEALKLREETLALQKAKLGPDHPDTLMSMNNLAISYAAGPARRGAEAPRGDAGTAEGEARPRPPRHADQHGQPRGEPCRPRPAFRGPGDHRRLLEAGGGEGRRSAIGAVRSRPAPAGVRQAEGRRRLPADGGAVGEAQPQRRRQLVQRRLFPGCHRGPVAGRRPDARRRPAGRRRGRQGHELARESRGGRIPHAAEPRPHDPGPRPRRPA